MANRWRKMEIVKNFIFLGSKITVNGDCHDIKRYLFLRRSYNKPRQCIEKQKYHFTDKGPCSQSYDFSSSHAWMWESIMKAVHWRTVVLDKTVESPLECEKIKPINPKGNQPWTFIGRTDAGAEAPILWHLMQRVESLEKTLMLGKIEGNRRRGQQRMWWLDSISNSMDKNLSQLWEIVKDRESWHAAPRDCKESDATEGLNNSKKKTFL